MHLFFSRPIFSALALLAVALPGRAQIFTEGYDSAVSIEGWTGSPAWSETAGDPAGAVVLSKSAGVDATSHYFTVPLELAEASDLTITFDALSISNVAGVFHFYAELVPFDQYFLKFNNEADLNNVSFTELVFEVNDVPATTTELTLRFELILGAVLGADLQIAIDNVVVTGPAVDPPGTWKGYTLVDEFWVDNQGQYGWLFVEHDPWLYSLALDAWLYLPEEARLGQTTGAWLFMQGVPAPAR